MMETTVERVDKWIKNKNKRQAMGIKYYEDEIRHLDLIKSYCPVL